MEFCILMFCLHVYAPCIYMYMYVYVCMYVCMYACMHVHACACMCMYVHACMHVNAHGRLGSIFSLFVTFFLPGAGEACG